MAVFGKSKNKKGSTAGKAAAPQTKAPARAPAPAAPRILALPFPASPGRTGVTMEIFSPLGEGKPGFQADNIVEAWYDAEKGILRLLFQICGLFDDGAPQTMHIRAGDKNYSLRYGKTVTPWIESNFPDIAGSDETRFVIHDQVDIGPDKSEAFLYGKVGTDARVVARFVLS